MDDLPKFLLSGLPSEPVLALFELRTRIGRFLVDRNTDKEKCRTIIAIFQLWFRRNSQKLDFLEPEYGANTSFFEDLNFLISSIDQYKAQHEEIISLQRAEEILEVEEQIHAKEAFGLAVLTDEDKAEIRERLSRIRSIISVSGLSERKKSALFSRISSLESEIELAGTKTDRFFAFLGDAAFVMGSMAEKSKPFVDEVKQIMRIVYRRREESERVRLPTSGDELLLPPPP